MGIFDSIGGSGFVSKMLPSGWGLQGMVGNILIGVGLMILIGGLGWWGFSVAKNKATYTNKLTLSQYYENGTKRTITGLMGGKFTNKSGVLDFKIKIPKQWKKKELGYTPDFSLADSDGTLHFVTFGDGSIWQQVHHQLVEKEEVEVMTADGKIKVMTYQLIIKPVRTDVKTVTVNSMSQFRQTIMNNKDKAVIFAIGFGFFFITVIAHLISLYIQTKIKCPAVP